MAYTQKKDGSIVKRSFWTGKQTPEQPPPETTTEEPPTQPMSEGEEIRKAVLANQLAIVEIYHALAQERKEREEQPDYDAQLEALRHEMEKLREKKESKKREKKK